MPPKEANKRLSSPRPDAVGGVFMSALPLFRADVRNRTVTIDAEMQYMPGVRMPCAAIMRWLASMIIEAIAKPANGMNLVTSGT